MSFYHVLYGDMQSFLYIVQRLGDIAFPPSRDTLLVREANPARLSALADHARIRDVTILLPFRDPLVRACIHEAKFHANKKAWALLGSVLREALLKLPQAEYVLIPVPLSASRFRARGYNQSAEIARAALEGIQHISLLEHGLVRTRNTKPQTDLTKEERDRNVKGAFLAKNPLQVAKKHIILFDDVQTTGATLGAAKDALLQHAPASVTLIAAAH